MQFTIIKKQEPIIALLGDKRVNVKLIVEIDILLSKKEKELISKYHDPAMSLTELKEIAGSSIKITEPSTMLNLSKFKLVAHTNDGYNALGIMQKFVDAVIKVIQEKIDYLEALEAWEGKEVVTKSPNKVE